MAGKLFLMRKMYTNIALLRYLSLPVEIFSSQKFTPFPLPDSTIFSGPASTSSSSTLTELNLVFVHPCRIPHRAHELSLPQHPDSSCCCHYHHPTHWRGHIHSRHCCCKAHRMVVDLPMGLCIHSRHCHCKAHQFVVDLPLRLGFHSRCNIVMSFECEWLNGKMLKLTNKWHTETIVVGHIKWWLNSSIRVECNVQLYTMMAHLST